MIFSNIFTLWVLFNIFWGIFWDILWDFSNNTWIFFKYLYTLDALQFPTWKEDWMGWWRWEIKSNLIYFYISHFCYKWLKHLETNTEVGNKNSQFHIPPNLYFMSQNSISLFHQNSLPWNYFITMSPALGTPPLSKSVF